jgi:hypothetical protein
MPAAGKLVQIAIISEGDVTTQMSVNVGGVSVFTTLSGGAVDGPRIAANAQVSVSWIAGTRPLRTSVKLYFADASRPPNARLQYF